MSFQLDTRLLNTTREASLAPDPVHQCIGTRHSAAAADHHRLLDHPPDLPLALASKAIIANQPMPQLDESGCDEINTMSVALKMPWTAIRHRIMRKKPPKNTFAVCFDHAALGIARIELDGRHRHLQFRWDTTRPEHRTPPNPAGLPKAYRRLGALLDEP